MHEAVVVVRAEQAARGVREVDAQRVVRRAAAPVARRGGREEAAEERAAARARHVQEELQRVLAHLLAREPRLTRAAEDARCRTKGATTLGWGRTGLGSASRLRCSRTKSATSPSHALGSNALGSPPMDAPRALRAGWARFPAAPPASLHRITNKLATKTITTTAAHRCHERMRLVFTPSLAHSAREAQSQPRTAAHSRLRDCAGVTWRTREVRGAGSMGWGAAQLLRALQRGDSMRTGGGCISCMRAQRGTAH